MTRHLTLDLLLRIAEQSCGVVVVRDYGLLESALARPAATVFGDDAYPTIHGKAAAKDLRHLERVLTIIGVS
ncbi:MAG: hypothetical protein ABR608_08950 [Pseudonocardiaceae bacterium]